MKHLFSWLLFAPLLAVIACSGSGNDSTSGNNGFNSGLTPSSSTVGSSWLSADIGSASGSTTLGTSSFTLSGLGKFESTAQTFRYVYTTVTGDFTVTAKLESYTGASSNQGWAGLMLAPSITTTGSNFLFASSVKRGDGTYYSGYRAASGNLVKTSMSAPSVSGSNVYLKLTRSGSTFKTSYSLDGGSTWGTATTGTFSSTLADSLNVGFIVNSGSTSVSATALFSSVVITDGSGNVISGGSSTTTAVTGVTLSSSTLSLSAGATSQLGATIVPSNATNQNVTWASSNTAVATVSATGLVSAVSAGTATITVTTADGSKTATCAVTVSSVVNPLPTITSFSPTSGSVGTTVNITGTNFSTTASSNTVKFNGITAVVSSSSSTLITAAVPSGATTGTITVTTAGGSAVSSSSFTVSTSTTTTNSIYNMTGFASATTGGGNIAETNAAYAKVGTAQDLVDAVYSWYKGKAYTSDITGKTWGGTTGVSVIEITADLNLGYKEVGTTVTGSTAGSMLAAHATPKLHPVLITTGVSKLDLKKKTGGLTLFSRNGATIKHCTLNVKSTYNIIIRNLKFDEMWEWDESSKGNYDGNDWDFIDLGNGGIAYNVWIDHCTFTKAYDGIVDIKAGCYNVTFSWNKYIGDDGATNSNSFVRQQFNYLEKSSSSYAMYYWLRTHGFSIDDLVFINQGHDKTHLVGSNSNDSGNSSFTITYHHQWFMNVWDRNPARLRGGQIHAYDCYFDDTVGLTARRLRDTRIAAMAAADQVKLNGSSTTSETYHMGVFLNGSISTEGGAFLVEKSIYNDCLYPLRNNQTDVTDATYTGKIKAIDTVYHFDNADGSVIDLRGDSTNTSTFPATYANGAGVMGPGQATIIPFSWNTTAWNTSGLPYTYTTTDPSSLKSVLSTGCGAGIVNWNYSNWLVTSY